MLAMTFSDLALWLGNARVQDQSLEWAVEGCVQVIALREEHQLVSLALSLLGVRKNKSAVPLANTEKKGHGKYDKHASSVGLRGKRPPSRWFLC